MVSYSLCIVDVAGNYIVVPPLEVSQGGQYEGRQAVKIIFNTDTHGRRDDMIDDLTRMIEKSNPKSLEDISSLLADRQYNIVAEETPSPTGA